MYTHTNSKHTKNGHRRPIMFNATSNNILTYNRNNPYKKSNHLLKYHLRLLVKTSTVEQSVDITAAMSTFKPGVLEPGTFMYNWTEFIPRIVCPT